MGVFDFLPGVGGDGEVADAEPSDDADGTGGETAGRSRLADMGPADFRERADALTGRSDVPTLDFTVESLDPLDDLAAGPPGAVDDRVAYGSYLGETIIREFDGEWVAENGWQVAVELPDDRTTVAVFDAAEMAIEREPVFAEVVAYLEAQGAERAPDAADTETAPEPGTDGADSVTDSPSEPAADAPSIDVDDDGTSDANATTTESDTVVVDDPMTVDDGADGVAAGEDFVPPDDGVTADATALDDEPTDDEAGPAGDSSQSDPDDAPVETSVGPGPAPDPFSPADGDRSDESGATTDEARAIADEGPEATGADSTETDERTTPVVDEPPETGDADAAADPVTVAEEADVNGEESVTDGDRSVTDEERSVMADEQEQLTDDGDDADEGSGLLSSSVLPFGGSDARDDEEAGDDSADDGPIGSETDGADAADVGGAEPMDEDGPATDDAVDESASGEFSTTDYSFDYEAASPAEEGVAGDGEATGPVTDDSMSADADSTADGSADDLSAGEGDLTDPADSVDSDDSDGPADTGYADDSADPADATRPVDDALTGDGTGVPAWAGIDANGEADGGEDVGVVGEDSSPSDASADEVIEHDDSAAESADEADGDPRTPERYVLRRAAEELADGWPERELDFTPESLPRLDAFVDDQWDGRFRASSLAGRTVDHEESDDPLTQLGAYYGEVLVRWLDGEWVATDDGEGAVAVPDVGERVERVDVFGLARDCLVPPSTLAYCYDALVNRLHVDRPAVSDGRADIFDDPDSLTSVDVITQFAEMAEAVVDEWDDYPLDYTPRSVRALDEMADRLSRDVDAAGVPLADGTDPDSLWLTAHSTAIGAYFAAVLLRHRDAQWRIDGDDVELVVDRPDGERTVNPVATAADAIRREGSFVDAYTALDDR